MSIQSFFKSLTSPSARRRPTRRRAQTSRLRLEALEDRTVPSTFTVTNLLDTGAHECRDAAATRGTCPVGYPGERAYSVPDDVKQVLGMGQ